MSVAEKRDSFSGEREREREAEESWKFLTLVLNFPFLFSCPQAFAISVRKDSIFLISWP